MAREPSSLKILHILDHSLPVQSGYTFRSQNIFRAQRQRGWQPVVLTSPKHEASWKGERLAKEEIGGIRYYRTGPVRPDALALWGEWRLMSTLARRIREVVEIERPDLLHVHSPILNALPALRVARRLGLPVVYEVRAFWEDAAVDHGTYGANSWKYKLVQQAETWVCRRSDRVTVLCQGLKDDLVARGIPAEKLTVIFNGINGEEFCASPPDAEYRDAWNLAGKKTIGFIGSFYRYEGLALLVEAFARLASARADLRLVLAGGGEVEAKLRAQAKQLGLDGKVILPGRIPHERTPGVYALMDVLVYPRLSMRLTELVTPLKPLEAMAMGKALVASDVGGHRELIRQGETGALFPAGDIAALQAAIERLLGDDALCQRLGTQGRSWVHREHSWEKTTAPYADVYRKALDRDASGAQAA